MGKITLMALRALVWDRATRKPLCPEGITEVYIYIFIYISISLIYLYLQCLLCLSVLSYLLVYIYIYIIALIITQCNYGYSRASIVIFAISDISPMNITLTWYSIDAYDNKPDNPSSGWLNWHLSWEYMRYLYIHINFFWYITLLLFVVCCCCYYYR